MLSKLFGFLKRKKSSVPMQEKHLYETSLQYSDFADRYDCEGLQNDLISYFEKNAAYAGGFRSELKDEHETREYKTWNFNSNGVSIHIKLEELDQIPFGEERLRKKTHNLDIKLISEVTPTQALGELITQLAEVYKINKPELRVIDGKR